MENKKYVSNAFSLQMLTSPHNLINVDEIDEEEFKCKAADARSAVGHPDTAAVLGVAFNRVSLKLNSGDELYIAQLVGGRLPEGATKLPDGFTFKYYHIII